MVPTVMLGLLTVLGPVSMDLYLPGLPDVSASLGLGRGAASATLFVCLAGLAAGQIFWGQVIDRHGMRGPLLLAISLWIAASVGCALAADGAELVAMRAVQGIAGGCGMTVARAVLAQRLTGHLLAAGLARIALVTNVCAVSAPLAGGALLGAVGWRGLFLALAGWGMAVLLIVAATFGRTGARRDATADSGPGGRAAADRVQELLLPLRSPGYVRAAAVTVVSFAQVIVYVSLAPAMLRGHYRLGGAAFGLVFAVTVAALVVGTRTAPLLLRRHGAVRWPDPLVFACGLAAVASVLQMAAGTVTGWPPLPILTVLLALGNATIGVLIALSAAVALSSTTAGAGVAAGLLGGLQFGGGAALASLVTATGVRGLAGYGLAGTVMCLLCAVGTAWAGRRSEELRGAARRTAHDSATAAGQAPKSGAIGFIERGN
jgi:DHA1 family bicyclomycin/chloramphenicol resistance-like MFS transporter